MNVTLSPLAGFCPGVKRADSVVERLISENDAKIYTLGHLIHNRIYNDELYRRGVRAIDISSIKNEISANAGSKIILLIRTHGIPREQSEYLANLEREYENFHVEDVSCPYVKRIHHIAEENTDEHTLFLLFCDPDHPEAIGIMSYAKGEKYAFSSLDELKNLLMQTGANDKKLILCSQTTQNLPEYKKIKKFLEKLYTNSIFFDTICSVTENRQNEAIKIAKASDAMIVIGGKESSNTHKLYDLCQLECSKTLWIESPDELVRNDFFDNAKSVGITAGASTPDGIITEVLKLWKKTKK